MCIFEGGHRTTAEHITSSKHRRLNSPATPGIESGKTCNVSIYITDYKNKYKYSPSKNPEVHLLKG